jgi:hypothetical protein
MSQVCEIKIAFTSANSLVVAKGISSCDFDDLPKSDSHSRLQIHIPSSNASGRLAIRVNIFVIVW